MNHGTINLDSGSPSLDGRQLAAVACRWLEESAQRLGTPVGASTSPSDCTPSRFSGTVQGYAEKIKYFLIWWNLTGPTCGYILDRAMLLKFEHWLRQYNGRDGLLAYHTRRDALRRLRAMLRWACDERIIIGVDAALWVPVPNGQAPDRNAVSIDDLRLLAAAAQETSAPERDYALLAIFVGTGMRRRECAMLDVTDVTFAADGSGSIDIRFAKRSGGAVRRRQAAFDGNVGNALRRWLYVLQSNDGPLWPSPLPDRDRLSPTSIYRIIRRLAAKADVELNAPCHDLRRLFVTHWDRVHRDEGSRALLRRQVGHTSSAMTDLYSLSDLDDLRSAHVSPLDLMSQPY